MDLTFEVKKVNSGVDRYEEPFVEVVLRTRDFTAMTLAKYVVGKKPMKVKIED